MPNNPGNREWRQAERSGRPPVDLAGAADYLGTTPRHVRRLVTERRIPYVKIGRFTRLDPDDLDEWISAHRIEVAAG